MAFGAAVVVLDKGCYGLVELFLEFFQPLVHSEIISLGAKTIPWMGKAG